MKVLVIADEEAKSLWDHYSPEKLEDIDLIISCGDLNARYLEFLVTFGHCPLLYVRGNHDEMYGIKPPEGCICIEDMIYDHEGLRIGGLGGAMKYKQGPDLYTEGEMSVRTKRLSRKVKRTNGIDILVTHAPAKGYGDLGDLPHRGFECFNRFLLTYKPAFMLHGHVHKAYGHAFVRRREHPSGTVLINADEYYILDIPEGSYPEYGHTGSFFYDVRCRIESRFKGRKIR